MREADRSFDAGRTRGRQVGFKWAKDDALLGHLREVVDWKKPQPEDVVRLLRDDYGMMFDELAPDLARNSPDESGTKSDELGPDLEDSRRGLEGELYMEGLARGFVEGAKQLWARVKARVFSQGEDESSSQ